MVGGREHSLGSYLKSWAGFLLGGLAVIIAMQANYAVVATRCAGSHVQVIWISALLIALCGAGGAVSYMQFRDEAAGDRTRALVFVALVNAGFAALMLGVLLLHLLAGLVFTGCEQ